MSFKEQLQQFKPKGDAMDPYLKGREEYFDRYGLLSKDRDMWRKFSKGLLVVVGILSAGMIYTSTRSEFIPFMLEKDSQTGYVQAMGPVTETKYTPGDAEITYFLGDVIKKVRTVPLDPVVYKSNWSTAAAFMSSKVSQKMNAMAMEEGQGQLLGKATVQPNILSVQPLSSTKNTYQVRWTEEVFSITNSQKIIANYSGTFTVSIKTPKDKKDYYINPIGMVIEDFSYSRENSASDKGGTR